MDKLVSERFKFHYLVFNNMTHTLWANMTRQILLCITSLLLCILRKVRGVVSRYIPDVLFFYVILILLD